MRRVEGIYRCGNDLRGSGEKPLVLVHPWYCTEGEDVKLWSGEGDYFDNLDNLISSSRDRSVILFEEYFKANLRASSEKIIGLRGRDGFCVVPTDMDNSNPKYTSWKGVYDFVKVFSDKVDVAGGYVGGKKLGMFGCAGSAAYAMRRNGIDADFIDGCCFTY